jgi:hypothetical protein
MYQVFTIDATGLMPDANGFLTVPARVTKPGVFPYLDASGKVVQQLRHPDEVFKADSLKTLAMKPVTDEHPAERYVDATNARQMQRGSSGDSVSIVDADGNPAQPGDATAAGRVMLVITDAGTVDKIIKGGKRSFSSGYLCDVIDEVGTYNGQPYSSKQVNIRYNHIALTGKPRLGADMTITDSIASADDLCYDLSQEPKTMKFKKQVIGGQTFAAVTITDAAEAQAELDLRLAASESAAAAGAASRIEADTAIGKIATLEAQITELKATRVADSAPEVIAKAVDARLDVMAVAAHFGVAVKRTDSDESIMRAVLASKSIKVDSFSAERIAGAFDALAQQVTDHDDAVVSLAKLRRVSAEPKKLVTDKGDETPDRQTAYLASKTGAWKGKA